MTHSGLANTRRPRKNRHAGADGCDGGGGRGGGCTATYTLADTSHVTCTVVMTYKLWLDIMTAMIII